MQFSENTSWMVLSISSINDVSKVKPFNVSLWLMAQTCAHSTKSTTLRPSKEGQKGI